MAGMRHASSTRTARISRAPNRSISHAFAIAAAFQEGLR
jgi:hypothetical protein